MSDAASMDVPNLDSESGEDAVRHECVDCHATSPPVSTNFTLISARFGWRLHRGKNAQGRYVMEWRCPKCWEEFRGRAR